MTMTNLGGLVTLSLSCEGCNNKTNFSRIAPPHWPVLVRARLAEEDESHWG
jgi:hypothetical protein